jgi:hypothetical protein
VLDVLATSSEVDLTVLYAMETVAPASTSTQALKHVHWFPRRLRSSHINRVLGRDYPVNWAILRAFHALRPDCMIIEGWSTFASHAAIAWCVVRRMPFLLLVDESDPADQRGDRNGGWQHTLAGAVARTAAAVIVPERATHELLTAYGVRGDRQCILPDATDAAAARMRTLAFSAWAGDSSTPAASSSTELSDTA